MTTICGRPLPRLSSAISSFPPFCIAIGWNNAMNKLKAANIQNDIGHGTTTTTAHDITLARLQVWARRTARNPTASNWEENGSVTSQPSSKWSRHVHAFGHQTKTTIIMATINRKTYYICASSFIRSRVPQTPQVLASLQTKPPMAEPMR
jgi:hypothetical protein